MIIGEIIKGEQLEIPERYYKIEQEIQKVFKKEQIKIDLNNNTKLVVEDGQKLGCL